MASTALQAHKDPPGQLELQEPKALQGSTVYLALMEQQDLKAPLAQLARKVTSDKLVHKDPLGKQDLKGNKAHQVITALPVLKVRQALTETPDHKAHQATQVHLDPPEQLALTAHKVLRDPQALKDQLGQLEAAASSPICRPASCLLARAAALYLFLSGYPLTPPSLSYQSSSARSLTVMDTTTPST